MLFTSVIYIAMIAKSVTSREGSLDYFRNDGTRPCRPEDGYVICRNMNQEITENVTSNSSSGGYCIKRYTYGSKYCRGDHADIKANDVEIRVQLKRQIFRSKFSSSYLPRSLLSRDVIVRNQKSFLRCHDDEFRCAITRRCIERSNVRDGHDDCSSSQNFSSTRIVDTSDEDKPLGACDKRTEFRCHDNSLRCIARAMVHDGSRDCKGGSDEGGEALECHNQTEFKCIHSGACIPRFRVNDGYGDCLRNSDEHVAMFTCLRETEFSCEPEARCIPRSWVKNKMADCASGLDEQQSLSPCRGDEFACGRSRCLPRKYLCDGIVNCGDKSDEIERCASPRLIRCKGAFTYTWIEFHKSTKRNMMCVIGLKTPEHILRGFKCYINNTGMLKPLLPPIATGRAKKTVPQFYIHENISVCSHGEDQCFASDGSFKCSRCLDNKTIISNAQICDNFVDCPDLSDECSCEKSQAQPLCKLVYSATEKHYNSESVCNGDLEFQGGLDEKFCYSKGLPDVWFAREENDTKMASITVKCWTGLQYIEAVMCDGVVECAALEDECSVQCLPTRTTTMLTEQYLKYFERCLPFYKCRFINSAIRCEQNNQYVNSSLLSFDVLHKPILNKMIARYLGYNKNVKRHWLISVVSLMQKICDSENGICSWRRYCPLENTNKTTSIELLKKCNLISDCAGDEDELDCPTSTHFYCQGGRPTFIPTKKYGDGHPDCSDNSDECIENEFSSIEEMIKLRSLRVFLWISGCVTVAGNLLVLYQHFKKLARVNDRQSTPYFNTVLLIHLALADLMMGSVLLTIGVKSKQYSGRYCYFDYEWRSSQTCNLIGVLTMVSSQTSMNIMVLLTGIRLYVTLCPFKAGDINVRGFHLLVATAWAVAILIAVLPVGLVEHFAQVYLIERNRFFQGRYVSLAAIKGFFEKTNRILELGNATQSALTGNSLSSLHQKEWQSWYFNTNEGRSRFPNRHLQITSYFGYYSSNSVCFPDYYTTAPPAFQYSFAVIAYDFLALVFICVSYTLIFHRSRKSVRSATGRRNRNTGRNVYKLKRRVFYIIMTDAACWLPIVMMALVSYTGHRLPGIMHPVSAIVFMPINSAINPIIYSRLDRYVKKSFRSRKAVTG